jgi:hypothetical protein
MMSTDSVFRSILVEFIHETQPLNLSPSTLETVLKGTNPNEMHSQVGNPFGGAMEFGPAGGGGNVFRCNQQAWP